MVCQFCSLCMDKHLATFFIKLMFTGLCAMECFLCDVTAVMSEGNMTRNEIGFNRSNNESISFVKHNKKTLYTMQTAVRQTKPSIFHNKSV